MNKIFNWFYQKELNIRSNELYKAGLRIKDDVKYSEYVKQMTKRNITYSIILIVLASLIVLRRFI